MHLDMRWTAGKITAPFNIANKQSRRKTQKAENFKITDSCITFCHAYSTALVV
jgi:hypothetical protein